MGQLKTNETTESLIADIQEAWKKIGDPDISRITVVNMALSKYRDDLKYNFRMILEKEVKP